MPEQVDEVDGRCAGEQVLHAEQHRERDAACQVPAALDERHGQQEQPCGSRQLRRELQPRQQGRTSGPGSNQGMLRVFINFETGSVLCSQLVRFSIA